MRSVDGGFRSPADPAIRFPMEDGILRAFLPDDGPRALVADEMKAFYEENPFPNYDELETVGSLVEKSRARGFPDLLHGSIPAGARVLEVGCGTGQLGNFLSIAGRRVVSVDACWNSLRLARAFQRDNRLENVGFAQMNLFRLPLLPASFDVVICTGVLHHTADPREGFRRILPLVRPGGHVVIGLYNRFGRMQTRLRRHLFRLLGERFARIDPYLRRHRLGEAKMHAWYMDQYRNPHESLHTMGEVLRWFRRADVEFVRGFPSTTFGDEFRPDYRRSVFESAPPGSRFDRLLSQLRQMVEDTEGGLFLMIGRRT